MQPELKKIREEFQAAQQRLDRLAAFIPDESWIRRPAPDRWSPAECVGHLNLTSSAFLPVLREAIERARALGGGPPRRLRRDPVGWLIWKLSGPAGRVRSRTGEAFVPAKGEAAEPLLTAFARLQAEQIACVDAADGLPLHRIRIASPFDSRVRYSAYSALSILPRHQHRHLHQAERAAGSQAEI